MSSELGIGHLEGIANIQITTAVTLVKPARPLFRSTVREAVRPHLFLNSSVLCPFIMSLDSG